MKINAHGQVTIPKELRERYGLYPETEVTFVATSAGLILRSAKDHREELHARIERASGSATVPISTDEIIGLTRGEA